MCWSRLGKCIQKYSGSIHYHVIHALMCVIIWWNDALHFKVEPGEIMLYILKLNCVTGLCERISPVMIWWRHHGTVWYFCFVHMAHFLSMCRVVHQSLPLQPDRKLIGKYYHMSLVHGYLQYFVAWNDLTIQWAIGINALCYIPFFRIKVYNNYINPARPSDPIWRHKSRYTLAPIMVCYSTVPLPVPMLTSH